MIKNICSFLRRSGLTHTQPTLVHVNSEGRNESLTQVVAEGPGIAVAAEVPTHQETIHGGVGQHRLWPGVKVMNVHHTALILQIQKPERDTMAQLPEHLGVSSANIQTHPKVSCFSSYVGTVSNECLSNKQRVLCCYKNENSIWKKSDVLRKMN